MFRNFRTNAAYQFYFFRFMLGFFEGGFFPTVIVYLTYWFRRKIERKQLPASWLRFRFPAPWAFRFPECC